MSELPVPQVVQYRIDDQLAAALRFGSYPYRVRLVPRGERGLWLELMVLPHDTAAYEPAAPQAHVAPIVDPEP